MVFRRTDYFFASQGHQTEQEAIGASFNFPVIIA